MKDSGGELDWQEVSVDDAHIHTINKMAAKLEKRQSAEELVTVRQRRQQLNDRSASLSPPSSLLLPSVSLYLAPEASTKSLPGTLSEF